MTEQEIERCLERFTIGKATDVMNFDYAGTLAYIQRLKAENAALRERLSRAVELPCSVGTTVYGVGFFDCEDAYTEDEKKKREIFNYCMKMNGDCEKCKYRRPSIEEFVCTHIQIGACGLGGQKILIVGEKGENYTGGGHLSYPRSRRSPPRGAEWREGMIQHFSMNIQGAIENARDLKGCITVDGKTLDTVAEIRKFLRGQLAMGRKFLPICRCSNFDYQTGCKGHEHPEEWLKLKSIGLRNPTEVENDEGKTLVTVGLDPISLVQKWKEHFGFREDTTIWLEADDNLIQSCRKKTEIKGLKPVEEILNEQRVYFWEGS